MEIIANAVQTVPANQNVYFTDTVICGNQSISHRDDSGLVILRGVTNCQNRARFMVTFGGTLPSLLEVQQRKFLLLLRLMGNQFKQQL